MLTKYNKINNITLVKAKTRNQNILNNASSS